MKTVLFKSIKQLLYVLFALFGFLSYGAATVNTYQLPGGHSRWIGTLEGSMVDEQGSGLVYDFKFKADGTVIVEKSMTVSKPVQLFKWTYLGKNIQISSPDASLIPELNGVVVSFINEKSFKYIDNNKTEVDLRKSKPLWSWLHWGFLFLLLLGVNEVSRKSKYFSYFFYFIIPIVMIPMWLDAPFDGWFRWVKLYSAVAGCVLFTLFRFNGLHKYKWAKFAVLMILGINIAEAVMQDWSQPDLANKINAIAGFLNIITISRWMTISRDEQKPHDMLWVGMTTFWIIAYDVWNGVFVYLNFPNTIALTVALLIAPTIAALYIKKGSWLQARAFTLATYFIYLFTFKKFADDSIDVSFVIPLPRSENIAITLAVCSLLINVVYAFLHFRWRFYQKAPVNLQVGQNESAI
jgi:hypothetical protein